LYIYLMSLTLYKKLISQFGKYSVLVIGDMMLDVYLHGASTRLTPEAPVPVVDVLSTNISLGGAANTALNLKYLGANVTFCSVIGQDKDGETGLDLLKEAGITTCVLRHSSRTTLVKTRILAGHQLLTRYDSGSEHSITSPLELAFIKLLQEQYTLHDGIVVADYNKGLITPTVIAALSFLRHEEEKFIAVDSKRLTLFKDLRPSLVKPNYPELVQLMNLDVLHQNRAQQVKELGEEVFNSTGAAITAVTLDEEGSVIFNCEQDAYRCCAHTGKALQVAGAGDTYISTFTLASLAGATIPAAAELSAAAAAVALNKSTTASCTYQELTAYLSINEKYVTDLEQLQYICAMYKAQGKKIVFTNGCFDILHSGHVNYLNRARELGHVLVVGINTDESIKRLKGTGRPINQLYDRMEVLAGLGAVNHIIPFGNPEDDTASQLIQALQPDIFAKGGDYTKDKLPEALSVEEVGGTVVLLPLLPNRSTTLILNSIQNNHMLKLAELTQSDAS
jgi:D-beta-D-heptose 7-phosphate kinase / D-beta-D-heptose 1-phosphate adenosyltransferase